MTRTNFHGRKNIQVAIQPNIGLDAVARQSVVEMLNLLLADESVLALVTRRAEGHAGGSNVPNPGTFYGAQFNQINAIIDEIKERIQILGGTPRDQTKDFIDSARLAGELSAVPEIISLLADHEAFIRFLREDAQKCSEVYEDQGTFVLLIRMLRIHEKMAWLLRSNIDLEQFKHEK
jgi:starvation-inducible DNA-binding protein